MIDVKHAVYSNNYFAGQEIIEGYVILLYLQYATDQKHNYDDMMDTM